MEIIPAINCATKECAANKVNEVRALGVRWAHVDITDGAFSATPTWHDAITYANAGILIEVHLMVMRPELIIDEWLEAGARRIIVHVESLAGKEGDLFLKIVEKCKEHGAELALSENPDTSAEELVRYADHVNMVHLLAVNPGPSGQHFDRRIIEKIKTIHAKFPDMPIEIDGGVNPEVARAAREAGATHAAAASFIFESADVKASWEALKNA